MNAKDIFGLAVRLLGLLFLYLGLKAFTQILDLDLIENPDKTDLFNDLMPAAFNLVVAGCLIHGKLFTRWAYPESPKTILTPTPTSRQPVPMPESVPPPAPAGMEAAEAKLAALVERPKDSRP